MTKMANLPALTPTNFAEAMQFAEMLAKSTMVPREYQRAPANILLAVQWGAELGMPPLQALNSIAVINGKPAVYGDAMLALVRGSPLCEDVIERFEGEGDNLTAICEARRKGSAPVFARFSVADAKRAGLWDKPGPWKQYPQRMLQFRARGFSVRDAFPDVLRGVISAEEAADAPRVAKDVTPGVTTDLDAFAGIAPKTPAEAQDELEDELPLDTAPPPPTPPAGSSGDHPDLSEPDDLLAVARAVTFKGYKDFYKWYTTEIDDDQRTHLSPHIKGLAAAAHAADTTVDQLWEDTQ
jgi:hypothetical protein